MSDSIRSRSSDDQLAAMISEFHREKAALVEQRKELAILGKQTDAEIHRLAQQHREIPSQIRQMEANPEAFSRAEIQRRHTEARQAQMRQLMMQSQLDQLRARETHLEKVGELLDRILMVVDSLQAQIPDTPADLSGRALLAAEGPGRKMAEAAQKSIELAHRRISRQLQDETAQILSDLILRSEVSLRLLGVDQDKARMEIADLKQAASAALNGNRQLIHHLQPPALEELGLVTALTRHVENCYPDDRPRVSLQITGQERRLPSRVEVGVFRVMQEALANAARHSRADEVQIELRFEPGQLISSVVDKGRGFPFGRVMAEAAQKDSSGLVDMRLRASLIDGTLDISSRIGLGCTVRLAVPH